MWCRAGKSALARQLPILADETQPSLIIDRDPQRINLQIWLVDTLTRPAVGRSTTALNQPMPCWALPLL